MRTDSLKHVLIITPGFPKDEEDSNCVPAVQQAVLCYQQVYPETKITIISLQYPFKAGYYKWNCIDVYAIGGRNRKKLYTVLVIAKAFFRSILVQRQKPISGILCLWLRDTSLVGKMLSAIYRIPCIIWMHGQDAKAGNKYFRRIKAKEADLVAISEWQNEVLYQSYGIRAAHVVNNGINKAIFPQFNSGTRSIDLLAAGSMIPLKQYELFVELVRHLRDNGFSGINAVMAGDGEMEQELKRLIRDYNLDSCIKLVGRVPHKRVLGMMNDAKLFIHPSLYEGHSTVMLEAMYCGCKVLGFVPAGIRPAKNFLLCKDFEEMKRNAATLLTGLSSYERESYSDMEDSIKQLNAILTRKATALTDND